MLGQECHVESVTSKLLRRKRQVRNVVFRMSQETLMSKILRQTDLDIFTRICGDFSYGGCVLGSRTLQDIDSGHNTFIVPDHK